MHRPELRHLTHGDERSCMVHRNEQLQGFTKVCSYCISPNLFTPSLFLCIRFRTRFSALIKLSHFPSGANICQENHFLICCVVNLQNDQTIRSSPVIRKPASSASPTAHAVLLPSSSRFADTYHRKSSTGNSLLCLQTEVNVIAPLPSVSPTSCLKKSLPLMMLSMQTCLASAPSKTWLQILPITFLVQCGRSSSSACLPCTLSPRL